MLIVYFVSMQPCDAVLTVRSCEQFGLCVSSGASIPPEAMVHSPKDDRMGPPNFWL